MIYADILAHPEAEKQVHEENILPERTALDILQDAMEHITVEEPTSEEGLKPEVHEFKASLASSLAARLGTHNHSAVKSRVEPTVPTLDGSRTHHGIILRIKDVVRAMEDAKKVVETSTSTPVSVLSSEEWNALIDLCVRMTRSS